MSYQQLIQPNLSAQGRIGYCLEYAENFFNAPHIENTAWDAWNNTQFKHLDTNFPTDVIVPMWFSYFQNGVNYGHVAMNVPGQGIYSSPWRAGTDHAVLASLSELISIYSNNGQHPLVFEGWSEDISTLRVIKQEDEMLTRTREEVLQFQTAYGIKGNNPDGSFDEVQIAAYMANAAAMYADGVQYEADRLNEANATIDQLTAANLKLTDQLQAVPAPVPAATPNAELVTQVKENNSLLSQLLAKFGSIFK